MKLEMVELYPGLRIITIAVDSSSLDIRHKVRRKVLPFPSDTLIEPSMEAIVEASS